MQFKMTPLAIVMAGLSASLWAADAPATDAPATDKPAEKITIEGKGVFAGGKMVYEEASRARATVTYKAIEEKVASSNAFQLIDKLPGVNAFSQDATGLFGGSLTVRGFTAGQMGFTVDGAPVNDSGGYDVYPQEYVDAENLEEIFVTQGTTDNDAPHIGATGGNVGLISQKPTNNFRVKFAETAGGLNMYKTFARVDTGKTGPFKSYFSISKSVADKWRGEGVADRLHFDAKTIMSLGEGNSITAGLLYNKAKNNFFRSASKSAWIANRYYDYDTTFAGRKVTSGKADDESTLTNFYATQLNPFENYIVTLKGRFQLASNLRAELDPYFWYGNGSGGFASTLNEATFTTGGRDLNGDGDKLDKVLVWQSSKTVTYRPGVTARLSWTLGDHKLMAAYWHEEARHRQTRPFSLVDANGNIQDPWLENPILRNDGQVLNGQSSGRDRNWMTTTTTDQFTLEDAFKVGDAWNFSAGVRTPHTTRDGVNYGALSETQQALFQTSRGVTDGSGVKLSRTYSKVLPTASVKYNLDDRSHVFASVSRNFRIPQNFILFDVIQDLNVLASQYVNRDLAPEESTNLDMGYRYQGDTFNFNGSVFAVDFKNRQGQRREEDGTTRNFNVGDTKKRGFELEFGTSQRGGVSFYGSASYIRETLQNDFTQYVGTTNTATGTRAALVALNTTGKTMTDVPKWLLGWGTSYQSGPFNIGLGGKFTSVRYADLYNTEEVPAATLWDLNAGYKFANIGALKRPTLRFAITNLFDKNYLATISSQTTATAIPGSDVRVIDPGAKITSYAISAGTPSYNIGAPRFVSVQFSGEF